MHSADFLCVTKCIVCAENYTQTIHKPYIERQRVKETKSQREGESKRGRVKERTRGRVRETKRLRVKETEKAS